MGLERRTRTITINNRPIDIIVLPRILAKHFVPTNKTIMISIVDPGSPLEFSSKYEDILRLEFSDIENSSYLNPEWIEKNNIKLFNKDMADQILSFFDKHKNNIDTLVVHCYAGVSRSAAVASALCRNHGFNKEANYFMDSQIFFANTLVLALLTGE